MKIENYSILLLLVVFLSSYNSRGQKIIPQIDDSENKKVLINSEFCGTDFFHNQRMKNDEEYRNRYNKTNLEIQKKTSKLNKKASSSVYKIPVVVHIMHKGEAVGTGTNISDEDVKRGINYLNNYWRKIASSKGFGSGVDMKIEFVLAVQDENGNCTNGIDRIDMSDVPAYASNGVNKSETSGINDYDSSGGINSLKEYSIWNPTKYYNVWLVDEIDNKNCSSGSSYTAGYAYYASSHGQAWDGSVVLLCSYLDESSSVWAHEMGHAFNLPHTFDGDDPNNDGIGDQCGDDGIDDTPSHIRTMSISPSIYFSCNNNDANACDPSFNQIINPDTGFIRNSGTHQDHMHNYMDYTGCATEFTGGQRSVVDSALTTARASFLSSPALTPPSPATVYFTSSATNACSGSDLTFYDESSCTPNTYTNSDYNNIAFLWTFNNNIDPPITSTLQNPTITFTNIGVYDVTLSVTNPQGSTSLKKTGNIAITSGISAACSLTSTNNNANYSCGVTKVKFNTLNNTTTTFIPANATNDFTCSKITTVNVGSTYNLNVEYKSRNDAAHYLEVWIDWDNNGIFETSNNSGINERVLSDNIPKISTGSPSVSIIPPASVALNTILRMRVVSEYGKAPTLCGNGAVQRADDYGVYVKAACTPPTAGITNNSGTNVLTCAAPSISLTATGGVSYLWDHNKGITPSISITEPGTYTVTVTSEDGCIDTESILITENKPLPTAVITNNTGLTAITCDVTSISVTASGGVSYTWDNGLGNNATATITAAGTYNVTVTDANGCTSSKSIVIADESTTPACSISSLNNNGNFGCGVTKVKFNTINKTTTTFIPATAMQNFVCTDNTILDMGIAYNLAVDYKSRTGGSQFLEVWIDWDNNGIFELTNSNGLNEKVLTNTIVANSTGTPSVSITPPVTATLNTLLRMRVISEYQGTPSVCNNGLVKRADDYGVIVRNTLSTNKFLNSEFAIYPNPVKDYLTIDLKNNYKIVSYSIYDITGKKIKSSLKSDTNTIRVSELNSGLHIIKIKTTEGEFSSKFIKE